MRRWFALCLIPICLAGCRAPRPTLDSLGAFGNPCVPPPATGTVGYGQGYYQHPVVGSTARTLQTVPSLGSAPTQLRTSQVPQQETWNSASRPEWNSGAAYAPPRTVSPASYSASTPVLRDPNLEWIPPYASRPTRVIPATVQAPVTISPPPSLPPANLPPTLGSAVPATSYGLIPPSNAHVQYASPVRPSVVRPSGAAGCCGDPLAPTAYAVGPPIAPMGSTVTYETPYPAPAAVMYQAPVVASVPSSGYRVTDDGWQPRLRR